MDDLTIRINKEQLDNFGEEIAAHFDVWLANECFNLFKSKSKVELLKLIDLAKECSDFDGAAFIELLHQMLQLDFEFYKNSFKELFLDYFKENKSVNDLYRLEIEKQEQLIELIKTTQYQVEHFDQHVQKICDAIVEAGSRGGGAE